VARTERLWVSVGRLSDTLSTIALFDDVARYWQGCNGQETIVVPDADGTPREWAAASVIPRLVAAGRDPLLWHSAAMSFLARDRGTGALIADISLYQAPTGGYLIGGNVDRNHRGHGYGREALGIVCDIAHRHLGIADLSAGCETTNVASRRWLASCGFLPVAGPARHVLPNGRVIQSCWWRRSRPATRRCRNAPSTGPLPAAPAHRRVPAGSGGGPVIP
jgi:hypothetical protein